MMLNGDMFCCYWYCRLGELEKRLREDVQRKEIDSSDGENENAVENGDLSEEHRSFLFQNQLNPVLFFLSLFLKSPLCSSAVVNMSIVSHFYHLWGLSGFSQMSLCINLTQLSHKADVFII